MFCWFCCGLPMSLQCEAQLPRNSRQNSWRRQGTQQNNFPPWELLLFLGYFAGGETGVSIGAHMRCTRWLLRPPVTLTPKTDVIPVDSRNCHIWEHRTIQHLERAQSHQFHNWDVAGVFFSPESVTATIQSYKIGQKSWQNRTHTMAYIYLT